MEGIPPPPNWPQISQEVFDEALHHLNWKRGIAFCSWDSYEIVGTNECFAQQQVHHLKQIYGNPKYFNSNDQ